MYNAVRQYVPREWDSFDKRNVLKYTDEYRQLEFELRQAMTYQPTIRNLIRVQDVYSYGQFLIREQLRVADSSTQLYRVRMYIHVNKTYLDEVISYNLDPRRCGLGTQLTFHKRLSGYNDSSKIICVVRALTTDPNASQMTPSTSSDYYVEYIVEL